MISSYINADNQELVAVIINNGNIDSSISITAKDGKTSLWQPCITGSNEGETLMPLFVISGDDVVVVPKNPCRNALTRE